MSDLTWDGWREVGVDEWERSVSRLGRTVSDYDDSRKGSPRVHFFLPVEPIPDDAIGMCPNGHVMVRNTGNKKDGWSHAEDADLDVCMRVDCANPDTRTVTVIGRKS